MNVVQRLEFWGEHHHPKWIDLLRIALGVFLCFRGISFATHMGELMNLMTGSMPFSTFMKSAGGIGQGNIGEGDILWGADIKPEAIADGLVGVPLRRWRN